MKKVKIDSKMSSVNRSPNRSLNEDLSLDLSRSLSRWTSNNQGTGGALSSAFNQSKMDKIVLENEERKLQAAMEKDAKMGIAIREEMFRTAA